MGFVRNSDGSIGWEPDKWDFQPMQLEGYTPRDKTEQEMIDWRTKNQKAYNDSIASQYPSIKERLTVGADNEAMTPQYQAIQDAIARWQEEQSRPKFPSGGGGNTGRGKLINTQIMDDGSKLYTWEDGSVTNELPPVDNWKPDGPITHQTYTPPANTTTTPKPPDETVTYNPDASWKPTTQEPWKSSFTGFFKDDYWNKLLYGGGAVTAGVLGKMAKNVYDERVLLNEWDKQYKAEAALKAERAKLGSVLNDVLLEKATAPPIKTQPTELDITLKAPGQAVVNPIQEAVTNISNNILKGNALNQVKPHNLTNFTGMTTNINSDNIASGLTRKTVLSDPPFTPTQMGDLSAQLKAERSIDPRLNIQVRGNSSPINASELSLGNKGLQTSLLMGKTVPETLLKEGMFNVQQPMDTAINKIQADLAERFATIKEYTGKEINTLDELLQEEAKLNIKPKPSTAPARNVNLGRASKLAGRGVPLAGGLLGSYFTMQELNDVMNSPDKYNPEFINIVRALGFGGH